MAEPLIWEREGADWPNRASSRFVQAAGLRWHVQVTGTGPPLLLLHGTGASSHSWRDMLPLLARHFQVVAPDLPGHAFTDRPAPNRLSLTGMAAAVTSLLGALEISPSVVVGHSAGAAVLVRMCLERNIAPRALVSLNGALLPLPGLPGMVFSPLAKLLSQFDLVPRMFARHAAVEPMVPRLLQDTGSALDPTGVDLYRRLASNPQHVGAALDMVAHWDLSQLKNELSHLTTPLLLVTGRNDKTIPPAASHAVRALLPKAGIVNLPGLGHLAHEERPRLLAALLIRVGRSCGKCRAKWIPPHHYQIPHDAMR